MKELFDSIYYVLYMCWAKLDKLRKNFMTFMETKYKISINIISRMQRNKQTKKEQFIKQIKKMYPS